MHRHPTPGPRPTRGEALEPLCALLLDAVEDLHGLQGTDWAQEPYSEQERWASVEAARHVIHMMRTYGFDVGER